jgi:hypothetical protein
MVVHTRTLLNVGRIFFSRLAKSDRAAVLIGLRGSVAALEDYNRELLEHEASVEAFEEECAGAGAPRRRASSTKRSGLRRARAAQGRSSAPVKAPGAGQGRRAKRA